MIGLYIIGAVLLLLVVAAVRALDRHPRPRDEHHEELARRVREGERIREEILRQLEE